MKYSSGINLLHLRLESKEYFYFRKKSVISGDTKDLWENFPELREGTDIEKGINSEEFIVANYQSLKPFDAFGTKAGYPQRKLI